MGRSKNAEHFSGGEVYPSGTGPPPEKLFAVLKVFRPPHKGEVRFRLVRTSGGWHIHDIGDKDTPSLMGYLRSYKY